MSPFTSGWRERGKRCQTESHETLTPLSVLGETGLGPMLLAICVFLYMQTELEMKLLGVLRALGVRESVYLASWWIPFVIISTVNALLGAITAKLIDNVHVFQSTSFGSIFVSIFFLNVALVGGSFLLVAMAGGLRSVAALCILIMVLATWIPYIAVSAKSDIPNHAIDVNWNWWYPPSGLFWVNGNTVRDVESIRCYFVKVVDCLMICQMLVVADGATKVLCHSQLYLGRKLDQFRTRVD